MAQSGGDGNNWSNISATPALFTLLGGNYAITVVATWGGGSVALQMVGPDGSTLVSVLPNFTSNGYGVQYLPPGTYSLTITTATAVYAALTKVQV